MRRREEGKAQWKVDDVDGVNSFSWTIRRAGMRVEASSIKDEGENTIFTLKNQLSNISRIFSGVISLSLYYFSNSHFSTIRCKMSLVTLNTGVITTFKVELL